MMDSETWEHQNSAYLNAALTWLRLLLRKAAERYTLPAPVPPPPQGGLFGRRGTVSLAKPALVAKEDVAAAERAMEQAAAACDPPPALVQLANDLDMDPFERNVLLLCIALELSPEDIPALCGLAQGDATRRYPTFALATAVFPDQSREAFAPYRPLRHWRLLELAQPGGVPLTGAALHADERIVNYAVGLTRYLDDRLARLMARVEVGGEIVLPPSQARSAQEATRAAELLCMMGDRRIVQLVGPPTAGKRLAAWIATREQGRELYRLDASDIPTDLAGLETMALLWQREQILWQPALYVDTGQVDRSSETGKALQRVAGRLDGLVFVDVRDVWPDMGEAVTVIDVDRPTPDEQAELWRDALGEHAAGLADSLAGQFNLDAGVIRHLADAAVATTPPEELGERLWADALANTRPHLETLAQRIDAKANWDLIVLPQQQEDQLRGLCDQVRYRRQVYDDWGFRERMDRGLGITALFTGESGTGKTMAAEVIATDLNLALYRIDLSQVVSKYIGETEKNLGAVFRGAEDGGAILFFDEADALFGKRSEVRDSHDRYANIEINYLLQRMEAYRGLAILATNMKSALDPAFVRRLRVIVPFVFPGPDKRAEIWRKVFPSAVEKEDLDYRFLGKYNLAGGAIQNAALNAAFLAQRVPEGKQPKVMMEHILQAIKAEFRKADRPVNETEFVWKRPEPAKTPADEPVAAPD